MGDNSENRPYTNIAALNFPIELKARARASGFDTVFVDSLALPASFFGLFNDDEKYRRSVESYAKWRIDFAPPADFLLTEKETTIISVMEKIVNRGRLTRLSGELEQEIFTILKRKDSNYSKKVAINSFLNYHLPNIPNEWHDGEKRPVLGNMTAEEYFYKNVFLKTVGQKYAKDILPQVLFESLVIDKKNVGRSVLLQRLDFLITHGDTAIAVEIDDPTHSNHKEKDNERDKILEKSGLPTYRVNAEDLAGGTGAVPALVEKLKEMYNNPVVGGIDKTLIGIKLAHQFQMILIETLKHGKIKIGERTRMAFDPKNIPALSAKEQNLILNVALSDLQELSHNIGKLYRDANYAFDEVKLVEFGDKTDLVITVNDNLDFAPESIIYIQDISYPLALLQNKFLKITKQKLVVNEKALSFVLNYIYRFNEFRPNQIDGIKQTIEGCDSIVLLPTGSGKSVVYQLLSYIMPGLVLVIDPITSLIEDQVDNLTRMGADRVLGITAATDNKGLLAMAMVAGHYNLVFMSPERLQIEGFRQALKKLCARSVVPVCAIDEAHCVSEWGHDFRTSYLNLANNCRSLLKTVDGGPAILALTGTASEAVLRDMERDLGISDDFVIRPSSFDRKEIEFMVVPVESAMKNVALERIVEVDLPKKFGMKFDDFYETCGDKTMSGIVFCPHVGGKYGVMQVLSDLHGMGVEAKEYAGRKPKNNPMDEEEWSEYKTSIAKQYKDNVFPLLAATKSFGMGIDKSNIRYTIHYGLPQSIEAFYQEAGRAGRDKEKAYSYVIVSNDYPEHNKHLLGPSSSLKEMKKSMDEHKWNEDDVDRMLFFHTNAFAGVEEELAEAKNVLSKIGDISKPRTVRISSFQADREKVEKVIYRLSILGVVRDYTVDFSSNEFSIDLGGFDKKAIIEKYGAYVRGYQDDDNFVESAKSAILNIDTNEPVEFVLRALEILLRDFVYNIIEQSRRSAFLQLLEVTRAAAKISDEKARSKMVREEILRYLGNTQIDLVRKISEAPDDLFQIREIVAGLSAKKRADLYAEVGRELQAYPQHPGLLFARAYIRAVTDTGDVVEIADVILAVSKFGLELYRIDRKKIVEAVSEMMNVLAMKDEEKYVELLNIIFQSDKIDREVLMGIAEKVPTGFKSVVMMNLLNKTMENLNITGKDEPWRVM